MRTIAEQAVNMMFKDAGVTILIIPSFNELYPNPAPAFDYPDTYDTTPVDPDSFCVLYHSSGSTAFPKIRFVSQRRMWYDSFYLDGMGLMTTEWPVRSGMIRSIPSPKEPVVPMTPDMLLQFLDQSKATFLWCVPMFLEVGELLEKSYLAWANQSKSIEVIKKMRLVAFTGAPINPESARHLQRQGVSIQAIFAATEFSCASKLEVETPSEGPDWWRFADYAHQILIPQPEEPGIYEVALRRSPYYAISVTNTEIDGYSYYLTSDLVEEHPKTHGLYRVTGRVDDQLMLSTGEKTNPLPIEDVIMKDPNVEWAIMFGRGRLTNGILIQPVARVELDKIGKAAYRNLIWPSIEKANEFAPAHSRIFKEMIILSKPSKPFLVTGKGTLRKGAIIKDYSQDIDELYRTIEETSHSEVPIPDCHANGGGLSLESALQYVQAVIEKIMSLPAGAGVDSDLFDLGCDSLLATYIRITLQHAIRQITSNSTARAVPSNLVYQNPTVRQLAQVLVGYSYSEPASNGAEQDRIKQTEALIEKYTRGWPKFQTTVETRINGHETLLVTGTTGSIGSQVLSQLIKMPSIARIFAFNRASQTDSGQRHVEAFRRHGLEFSLLKSSKLTFLEGNLAVKGFGIPAEVLREKPANSMACGFQSIASLFRACHKGVSKRHETIDTGDNKAISEGPIQDISIVNKIGYAESKWVCERILQRAAKKTPLRPTIARVGQISGGLNGYWNIKEWFPALVQASHILGALPDNTAKVSFVPLYTAASALIELRRAPVLFAHIVHPRPVTWRSVLKNIEDVLQLPIIPPHEWTRLLENASQSNPGLTQSAAIHLIDIYRGGLLQSGQSEDVEILGLPTFETVITLDVAPSLQAAHLPQLGRSDVEKWITSWKLHRHLK
ncbi:hypothetical protein Clacol_000574 [Clathrus columnatus]|uniref:Carrier domain-containing protein n=1 Tax=Clathrus columnatus TaxID=1419009 RepID=A0AAV4ZZM7_9AGAM|nr:hypothetical protein Clacol_000574 [Clathrus columnatus]